MRHCIYGIRLGESGMSTSYVTRSLGLAPETPWDSIVTQLNNNDTLSADRRAALKNRVAGERIGKYITPRCELFVKTYLTGPYHACWVRGFALQFHISFFRFLELHYRTRRTWTER